MNKQTNNKKSQTSGRKSYYKGKKSSKYESRSKKSAVNDDLKEVKAEPGDVNNPGYYYDNTTVLDQVMNFSFNQYGNVPIDITFDNTSIVSTYNPMVMAFYLNPSVPQTDATSALTGVTTAALRNYTFLCGSNNKTTLYPPQVVIIVTLAVASLTSMMSWCSRALGLPYLYNYRNRAYPDMLFKSMGIDADDMRANLAGYRVRFNTLLAVANRIPFPAGISAIAKASEIYGSVYLDDDNSSLAQTYLFNPKSVWTYNETYDTDGSGLDTTPVCDGTIRNFSSYLDILENMISQLLNSTALNAVYSDVIRLVQTGKLSKTLVYNPIPESFTVIPVYNTEISTWIHNCVIVSDPLNTASHYDPLSTGKFTNLNDVKSSPNSNTIQYHPQFKVRSLLNQWGLLDFDHDNVSLEDKVRATRFAFRATSMSNGSDIYTDDIAVMDYYMTQGKVFLSSDPAIPDINIPTSKFDIAGYTKNVIVNMIAAFSKFDWCPLFYITTGSTGLDTQGDVDFYTNLDYSTISKIYDYEVIHYLEIG